MRSSDAVRATGLIPSAELGGTGRALLDFAARAFEFDVALRVLTPRHGPLIRILEAIGVPAQVVEASRAPAFRRLARHPWVQEADVVYSVGVGTHLATLPRPAAAERRKDGTAVVWHLHAFPPARTGLLWRTLAKRAPDTAIAASRAVSEAWYGPPVGRSAVPPRVIPTGVDLDRFRPRERTGWLHDRLTIPREDRLVGLPAGPGRWNGQPEVIEAFGQIAEQFPEVHLVLVGSPLPRTIRGTRIHTVEFQPKIEPVYAELDVAVHYPTRPVGTGRVVVEAMASGVPVIAAAEGGPREVVTEGGWLAPPRRPEALAAALVAALRLPVESLREVGRQGRTRAEDRYSARRYAREVAEVLKGAR